MKKITVYAIWLSIAIASFGGVLLGGFVGIAFAQNGGGSGLPGIGGGTGSGPASSVGGGLTNPLGASCTSLTCPASRVVNLLLTIAIPLCAIMVLVGGFQMMMSAGNPEKFSQGKKTLVYAAIGFAVVLIAGSVATLIQNFLKS